MDYKKLIEAHSLFYQVENRAFNYDGYLKCKKWASWNASELAVDEIKRLFSFIKSWDRFFQGDVDCFKEIYREIFSVLQSLKEERIENAQLTKETTIQIRDVFDKVANCTLADRYESTDASKILHTIIPNFFVMWDDKIKEGIVKGGNLGSVYAITFLPRMQSELRQAIEICITEKKLDRESAIHYIRGACDGKTLAKLADEYNYMKFTKKHPNLC
jgi:hypothetical protein